MKAMILAAGRGERLRPLTDHCPKPLVLAGDKALIEYHLEHLVNAGFTDVVINHAWLGHMLEQKLADGGHYGIKIRYSPEVNALETGGGIVNALPLLHTAEQPFLVINGDIYIDRLPSKTDLSLPKGMLAKLFLVANPAHNPEGDFALEKHDKISLNLNDRLTFSGIGVYHPQLFANAPIGAFPLPLLLKQAIQNNQVCGQYFVSYWCDVGTTERLQSLQQHLNNK